MAKIVYEKYWGIDVSKDWVDISIENKAYRIHQVKEKIISFIKEHYKENEHVLAVLESTGGYEKLIARTLAELGVKVHIAHPNKVVAFAKARGRLAKTDKIDSHLLASYGRFVQEIEPIKDLKSPPQEALEELSARLMQLKEMHHQEACRLGMPISKPVQISHEKILCTLGTEIKSIQAQIEKLIEADPTIKAKYAVIRSMKGVGPVLALTLICELPELGKANKKEIAALVGVAPITNQSGQKSGRSSIRYGRSYVRKTLYMGALVACKHQPKMKSFYESLIQAGKAKKVAIVAVMRRMIVILNAMVQSNSHFVVDF